MTPSQPPTRKQTATLLAKAKEDYWAVLGRRNFLEIIQHQDHMKTLSKHLISTTNHSRRETP